MTARKALIDMKKLYLSGRQARIRGSVRRTGDGAQSTKIPGCGSQPRPVASPRPGGIRLALTFSNGGCPRHESHHRTARRAWRVDGRLPCGVGHGRVAKPPGPARAAPTRRTCDFRMLFRLPWAFSQTSSTRSASAPSPRPLRSFGCARWCQTASSLARSTWDTRCQRSCRRSSSRRLFRWMCSPCSR